MKMPGPHSRTKSSVNCSRSSQRGMAIVCRRSLSLLMLGVALITVLPTAAFRPESAARRNSIRHPIRQAPPEAARPKVPPIQAIEAALAEARTRLAALERGADLPADPEVDTRRVCHWLRPMPRRGWWRVLEQRREAQIQIDALPYREGGYRIRPRSKPKRNRRRPPALFRSRPSTVFSSPGKTPHAKKTNTGMSSMTGAPT